MKMKNFIRNFSCFTIFLFSVVNMYGQGTSARMSGTVKNAKGEPLVGAAVQIKNNETGFKTGQVTDVDGNYDLQELPLGGPYTVTISYVGHQERKQDGIMLSLGDHTKQDYELKEGNTLGEVVVTGNSMKSRTDRLGSAMAITGKTIATIPTPSRNFEQLTFLSGQSYTPDVGQRNLGGFTLAGGKGGNGGFTVDGANTRRGVFGATLDGAAFTISQEAIREFEVETNAYSVKNGRNSGGVVKAVTKSGGNTMHGAAWYYAGGGALSQQQSATAAPLSSVPVQGQYGLSLSGPIIKDKLFYFVVGDYYKTSPLTDPRVQTFLDYGNSTFTGEADANAYYGYTKADAEAVLAAGKAKGYNIGGGIGNLVKDATTANFFGRLDWNINDNNTASIRYNYLNYTLTNEGLSGNTHGLGGFIPYSGARVYGTNAANYPFLNLDHKIIGDLRTKISDKVLNKLVFQYNTSNRENQSKPDGAIREPRVFVGVPAANGLGGGSVAFGQLTWVPEFVQSKTFQIIDDITVKAGDVTWTFGTNNQFYTQNERLAHWTAPVVVYNNIDSLKNDKPSFYRQILSDKLDLNGLQTWKMTELSAYAEAAFKIGANVNVEAGLRWDGWIQGGKAPNENPALTAAKLKLNGRELNNTAQLKDLSQWQPRLQLTWDLNGEKKDIFKVGGGLFASPITTQPITQTIYNDGLYTRQFNYTNTADILKNVGVGNFADPKTWLSNKYGYLSETKAALPTGSANIIMLDPGFKMPSALRINGSYTHFFNDKFRATLTGFYNVGFNDNYWVNANRKVAGTNPVDGREVMAPQTTAVNDVIVFTNADWTSKYMAAQLDINMKLGKDGLLSLSLTKAKGTGVTVYHAGGVFDDAEYVGTNYYGRYATHYNNSYQNGVGDKIVLIFASPEFKGFTVGFNVMAAHQRRFSIISGGNPNSATDRDLAYIPYNTQLTQSDIANLQPVAQEVKDVINASQGQISGVYQGVYPWMYQTSMSIAKKFKFYDKYGLTLRMDIFNVLNAISHSAGYYKNLNSVQDDYYGRYITLYNYNGVSATNPTANYSVNKNQGTYTRGGSPYSIQFGARFDF